MKMLNILEMFSSPVELILVVLCLLIIALGLYGFIVSSKALKKAENPVRDRVAEFFRSCGAVSAENAVKKEDLAFWLTQPSQEKSTFDAMQQKGLIKKAGAHTGGAFFLDEEALNKYVSKK